MKWNVTSTYFVSTPWLSAHSRAWSRTSALAWSMDRRTWPMRLDIWSGFFLGGILGQVHCRRERFVPHGSKRARVYVQGSGDAVKPRLRCALRRWMGGVEDGTTGKGEERTSQHGSRMSATRRSGRSSLKRLGVLIGRRVPTIVSDKMNYESCVTTRNASMCVYRNATMSFTTHGVPLVIPQCSKPYVHPRAIPIAVMNQTPHQPA